MNEIKYLFAEIDRVNKNETEEVIIYLEIDGKMKIVRVSKFMLENDIKNS